MAHLFRRTPVVAAAYLAVAIVMTWPLARVMPREIAGDLGDPLFNSWVLLWTSVQLLSALRGDAGALGAFWNANIFHPAPLALARSENLVPQMLQAFPVVAATGNVVLAYNLLMLTGIALAGLGMYLFVRELTGKPLAAFVAGIAFAFAPFRLDQWSHLDVLSSQWMPFTLYGIRRFAVTGRLRTLAGATAAAVAQALSCLYYLAYFAPIVAAYAAFEMVKHRRLRDTRMWIAIAAAGGVAVIVLAFFLWPYVAVRRGSDHNVREIAEVRQFSADTRGFATISTRSRFLGAVVNAMPRNENQGFPGFTIAILALLAIVVSAARMWRREPAVTLPWWRTVAAWLFGVVLVANAAMVVHLMAMGRSRLSILGVTARLSYRPWRIALELLVPAAGLMLASPRMRRAVRGWHDLPAGFFAWAALVAALLSLGPTVYAGGRELGPGLYSLLLRVPGFEAFRVASLFFMIVALFLAVLAGLGVAAIEHGRAGKTVAAVAALLMLLEVWAVPLETHAPPQIVVDGLRARPSATYQWVRGLPAGAVLVELPFGATFDEAGYTFASAYHRKRIVNGYSGFYPQSYVQLLVRLSKRTPDAWDALTHSGATHVVLHEGLYRNGADGEEASQWLRENGAREVAAFGRDRAFVLP